MREDLSMGVPAATPASSPVTGGPGRLKPLGSVVVVLGVVAVAVALATYVTPQASRTEQNTPAQRVEQVAAAVRAMVTHAVVYELSGGKSARNVTYVAEGSELKQETEVVTPWSTAFDRAGQEGHDEFYSVSAQGDSRGSLHCRILVDGVVVSENTAPAAGAPVTCTA